MSDVKCQLVPFLSLSGYDQEDTLSSHCGSQNFPVRACQSLDLLLLPFHGALVCVKPGFGGDKYMVHDVMGQKEVGNSVSGRPNPCVIAWPGVAMAVELSPVTNVTRDVAKMAIHLLLDGQLKGFAGFSAHEVSGPGPFSSIVDGVMVFQQMDFQ